MNITTNKQKTAAILAAGIVLTPMISSAAIIGYNEIGGAFNALLGGTGDLAGDSFDGTNFSATTSTQYFGAENGFFRLIDASGRNVYYNLQGSTTHPEYAFNTDETTLSNGSLDEEPIKNSRWLGATNDVNYYLEDDDTLIRYADYINFDVFLDLSWTEFSGGGILDGMTIPTALASGLALNDFAGGNAMNENWFVIVEADGTHGYYNLDNGVYADALSAGGYGNWIAFADGALDGLTLDYLKDNPEGVHNGTSYRFMGTSDDGMFFDIDDAVPEPTTAFLGGLFLIAGMVRRRRD